MIFPKLRLNTCQLIKRYSTEIKPEKANKEFKSTIFVPKTKFPLHPENVSGRDEFIQKEAKFLEYYEWQRKYAKGKEFVLHDGPPYANGKPHMGHAINKIFKDIILRSQLIQGFKVHFMPGWDCHGLPIEMIALKDAETNLSAVDVRKKSRDLALCQMELQKEAFKKWGILGNWDKCYYTCSSEYVVHELQVFWKLYEKGLIFHGLKPVYWSPTSKTALAEAELEYNDNHVSQAVTVRLAVENESDGEQMYLLIWTTTPWTLPFNKAVYVSEKLEYSLVKISSLPGSYVLATNLIEENEKKLNAEISVVRKISTSELKTLKYRHPWYKNDIMSVLEDDEVKMVATGLLHCAPAHGHSDFLLGLRDGLPVESFVDENGCYTKEVDPLLNGANVLKEGTNLVIEALKDDILLKESYEHSYPYDWRTKTPVIILSSKQWFIDTDKLKAKSIECLSDVSVPMDHFKTFIESRPYWCLSRQRAWGVPIPVFFDKKTGKLILSQKTVEHVCEMIKKFGMDSWWTLEIKDLIPQHLCEEFGVKMEDVEKGSDIMDIWFDSGVSWSFVLGNKRADVCLEGVDQFRGWFQSLLWTSVAVRGEAPYKKVLIHGSAVDELGRKMSKSIGNVFDPNTVVEGKEALGVDTLRWWVASHGHLPKSPVSERLLKEAEKEVRRLRLVIKFLLGSLNDALSSDVINTPNLTHIDRYSLNECYSVYYSIIDSYNGYDFQKVVSKVLHFISKNVSSMYINIIKDRLYCDGVESERRKSCIYTINGILDTLSHCIAPILPHLAEETYLHHPFHSEKSLFYNEQMWMPPPTWMNESSTEVIDLANKIKLDILSSCPKTQNLSCLIEAEDNDYNLLKLLQGKEDRTVDSELTEILQVADVELKKGNFKVTFEKTGNHKCLRCRRFAAPEDGLCQRCKNVLNETEARMGGTCCPKVRWDMNEYDQMVAVMSGENQETTKKHKRWEDVMKIGGKLWAEMAHNGPLRNRLWERYITEVNTVKQV